MPPDERRVDFREGLVCESSRRGPPFLAALFDALRFAVAPLPAFLSVSLTPGLDVSTSRSLRGRAAFFGFFGPLRSVAARANSALVAMY